MISKVLASYRVDLWVFTSSNIKNLRLNDEMPKCERLSLGRFSVVWKLNYIKHHRIVCVKGSAKSADSPAQWIKNEQAALVFLYGRNGVGKENILFPFWIQRDKPLALVFPFLVRGDLSEYLDSNDKSRRYKSIKWEMKIAWQIMQGLTFIHQNNIAHCDIKLSNILIETIGFKEHRLKISDFGCSINCDGNDKQYFGCSFGTSEYLAPESICKDRKRRYVFSQKTDTYALGVLLYGLKEDIPMGTNLESRIAELRHGLKWRSFKDVKTLSMENVAKIVSSTCEDIPEGELKSVDIDSGYQDGANKKLGTDEIRIWRHQQMNQWVQLLKDLLRVQIKCRIDSHQAMKRLWVVYRMGFKKIA